jgi:hypothetical protein
MDIKMISIPVEQFDRMWNKARLADVLVRRHNIDAKKDGADRCGCEFCRAIISINDWGSASRPTTSEEGK